VQIDAILPQFRAGRTFGQYRYHRQARAAMAVVRDAARYQQTVIVLPNSAAGQLAAASGWDGRIAVAPLTLLCAIAAKSEQAEGFTLQLTDLGTGAPVWTAPVHLPGPDQVSPRNKLLYFATPRIITEPGMLLAQLVNLSAVANRVSVTLITSEPDPESNAPDTDANRWIQDQAALSRLALRPRSSQPTLSPTGAPMPPGTILPTSVDFTIRPIDVATAGDNTIVSGSGSARVCIYALVLWNTDEQDVLLKGGTEPLMGPIVGLPAKGSFTLQEMGKPHFRLQPGQPFVMNLSVGARVTGYIKFRLEYD